MQRCESRRWLTFPSLSMNALAVEGSAHWKMVLSGDVSSLMARHAVLAVSSVVAHLGMSVIGMQWNSYGAAIFTASEVTMPQTPLKPVSSC